MGELSFAPGFLVVSEVFGPTLQGEGPSIGRPCVFLRLGQCNLSCFWCDTAYTWDWERFDEQAELRRLPVADVAAQIRSIPVGMVVISGGEPLIQQRSIAELLDLLPDHLRVEVETNGTIAPIPALADRVDRFNVSPKLANSGVSVKLRHRRRALAALQATGRAAFKFVATSPADLVEIGTLVEDAGLTDVYVMPEGRSSGAILAGMRELADAVVARGWTLTTRLHVLMYEDARGV